jgi:hypothetical protein
MENGHFSADSGRKCRSDFASGLTFDISFAEERVVRVANIKKSASSAQKAQKVLMIEIAHISLLRETGC